MNQVLSRLWLWVWQLVPANPILVRVVAGASRRPRHFWLRVAYLGALLAVVLFSLVAAISGQSASLTDLAKGASRTFTWASTTQLALMCFLAPVFTAAAITQERDAQTFNILLSTPLSSAQIVLGSLMSRLYFVIMLLIAGLPIFLITMVYGGVTTSQVFESFALSGATAVLTGALAIFVAMVRVGTRGTIFSFYLLIAIYLLSLYLLGHWSKTWIDASPANINGEKMSWLTPLHPFLALEVSLNRVYAPPYARLTEYSGVVRYALAYPAAAYITWTLLASLLLTLVGMLFVRRAAKIGEETLLGKFLQRFKRQRPTGERSRAPRNVWANPVAWREARTRSGGTGGVLRWALILGGSVAFLILFVSHLNDSFHVTDVRYYLSAVVLIQFLLVLVIATNTAATSMTREKESKSMDLLLATPLTSKYILWGKLRGLVSFALPLLLGPVIALLVFGVYGLGGKHKVPAIWLEIGPELGAVIVMFTACACVIGLRISLIARKTVTSVMYSVATMIVLGGIISLIGNALVENSSGQFAAFLAPFSPYTAVKYMIDIGVPFDNDADALLSAASSARIALLVGSVLSVALYGFVVWSIYTSLVRNFDMIVRKQSGT